jgi:hypothetical protein
MYLFVIAPNVLTQYKALLLFDDEQKHEEVRQECVTFMV